MRLSQRIGRPTTWSATRLRPCVLVPLVLLAFAGVFNVTRFTKGYIVTSPGNSNRDNTRGLEGSPCVQESQSGGDSTNNSDGVLPSSEGQQGHRQEEEGQEDTYTLVVVRCKANITWLEQVPSDWRIVVYEKCNRDTAAEVPSVAMTRHTPANMGAEECNGYFDFMHDYYYNLTAVTVFMHDDGLMLHQKGRKAHTPFDTFEPIVNATKQFVTKEHPFLHFGVREMMEVWGTAKYHGNAEKILWPYFALPEPGSSTTTMVKLASPPKELSYKPSAHMAVRKEQIQMRPQSTYFALLQQVKFGQMVGSYQAARQFCCAMERMWHIFFGEPPILPKGAMASDLLNITHCQHCNRPVAT